MAGNKNSEQKDFIAAMEDHINSLEDRLGRLRSNLDYEINLAEEDGSDTNKVNPAVENIQKEIALVENQMNYAKAEKKDAERILKEIEDEDKRREMEKILKGVMLVGIIVENNRIKDEYERRRENEWDNSLLYLALIDSIFAEHSYKFVTKDKVDTIMKSREFKEMAKSDPFKLEREEKMFREQYNAMMKTFMRFYDVELGDDFDANQKIFNKAYSESNGFKKALAVFDTDRHKSQLEMLAEGDPDKEMIESLKKRLTKLRDKTMKIQQDFASGKSDFESGNGYTEELIAEEEAICSDIEQYNIKILDRHSAAEEKAEMVSRNLATLAPDETIEDVNKLRILFEITQELLFPVKRQYSVDSVNVANNTLREKLESWQVYKKVMAGKLSQNTFTDKMKIEKDAWGKLGRIKYVAGTLGGFYTDMANHANKDAQEILNMADKKKNQKPTKDELEEMRIHMAAIVLNQIIIMEEQKEDKYRANINMITKEPNYETREQMFNKMKKELANSDSFKKEFSKYLKKGNFSDNCLKFLANDIEKVWAPKYVGKNIMEMNKAAEKVPKKISRTAAQKAPKAVAPAERVLKPENNG
ncbi:MAG: hypothetical protein K6F77_03910 [Lachnospiraceae bacterium]|nr:hypothetical protein [Lachnospiraceae bacterium]